MVGTDRKSVEPVSRKPARGLILVHEQLDDLDQPITGDLHLVDHQRRRPARQERHGIVAGGLQHRLVLERDIGSAGLLGDEPGQSRLARLARPVQDHDAEPAERVTEPVCQMPAKMPASRIHSTTLALLRELHRHYIEFCMDTNWGFARALVGVLHGCHFGSRPPIRRAAERQ